MPAVDAPDAGRDRLPGAGAAARRAGRHPALPGHGDHRLRPRLRPRRLVRRGDRSTPSSPAWPRLTAPGSGAAPTAVDPADPRPPAWLTAGPAAPTHAAERVGAVGPCGAAPCEVGRTVLGAGGWVGPCRSGFPGWVGRRDRRRGVLRRAPAWDSAVDATPLAAAGSVRRGRRRRAIGPTSSRSDGAVAAVGRSGGDSAEGRGAALRLRPSGCRSAPPASAGPGLLRRALLTGRRHPRSPQSRHRLTHPPPRRAMIDSVSMMSRHQSGSDTAVSAIPSGSTPDGGLGRRVGRGWRPWAGLSAGWAEQLAVAERPPEESPRGLVGAQLRAARSALRELRARRALLRAGPAHSQFTLRGRAVSAGAPERRRCQEAQEGAQEPLGDRDGRCRRCAPPFSTKTANAMSPCQPTNQAWVCAGLSSNSAVPVLP